MQNLRGITKPKSKLQTSAFSRSTLINERHALMKQKVNSVEYGSLKTIKINLLYDHGVTTLPDEHHSRASPTHQRIQTCESNQSMQTKGPKLPKIIDCETSTFASANSYKQRRFSSTNSMDLKKEKVPMSHFIFKSPSNSGAGLSKEMQQIKNIDLLHDPLYIKGRFHYGESPNNGSSSTRMPTEENATFPFTNVLFRDKSQTPQQMLKRIENFGLTRKVNLVNSPLDSKGSRCERNQTISKFERNEDLDEMFNDRFKIISDASAKYKSTIRTIESKKKNLSDKKPTNEEIILKNKGKLLVYADEETADENRLRFCFVTRSLKQDFNSKPMRADVEFNIKIDEVVRKLKLSTSFKYLYLLSGAPVFELSQIPLTESVVVLSKKIELTTVEHIVSNELIRDFYEYGAKQNLNVYSKSHVRSRMDSILQGERLVDDKIIEVLEVFDSENQLDSAQLGKLVEASKTMKNSEFKDTIQKHFGKQSYNHTENDIINQKQPLTIPITGRSDAGDDSEPNNSDMDGVITDRVFDSAKLQKGDQDKVQAYIDDKKPLCENDKLILYKEIFKYYKESMKGRPLKFEDHDLDRALKNLGISEHDNDGNNPDQDQSNHSEFNRPVNIGRNLEMLLKRWSRSSNKKMDYLDLKNELQKKISRAGSFSRSRSRLVEALEINHFDENLINVGATKEKEKDKNVKKDFIKENKKAFDNKKSDIHKLHKHNRELFSKNIPKHIEEKNLSRRELHYVYILYKALCEVTSQRYKEYHLGNGIDYHSFKNGIYQVFLQSDEVAEQIFYKIDCNFSGFLNWDEFINAMVIIRAKTMHDKIDLFIKIADEDGNGNLSKDEIFNLAKICLKKFVPDQKGDYLDSLCEYFTKLIFTSVNVSMDEEIPLESIKQAILSGNAESDLLSMFCGADI